jgi:flagellar motility protein MotE (MotC chaperone)
MNIRLLPVAIFVAVLMLGVKASDIWLGIEMLPISPSHAQQAVEKKPGATAAKPPAKAGAKKAEAKKAEAKKTKAKKKAKAGAGKAKSATQKTGAKATDKPKAKSGDGKADGAAEEKSAESDKKDEFPEDPTLFTQAEIDLLQRLADRRVELEAWRRDIALRERLLKATEKRLDKKVAELAVIQKRIKGLLKQYGKEQEAKLKSLVKIYENMKPKNAAVIFGELGMPVLLDVVERMREARVAPILAKMSPKKAKRVTTELALRRKMDNKVTSRGRAASNQASQAAN